MDISQIIQRLNSRVDKVAEHLLPNGKKERNEWVVGSVNGEGGQSCKVRLSGNKVGVWADFATGDKGDLLDLWCSVKSVPLSEAIIEAKDFLGIREKTKPERKKFTRPVRPKNATKPKAKILSYLQGRGLTSRTIETYKVAECDGHVIFPYMRDAELIRCKYDTIERDDNGKRIKRPWSSEDSEPCLFGWQAIDQNARQVTITEGELDALSMYQYGFPALSVPMGAGVGGKQDWIEYEWENLQRFEMIFLALDMDEAGRSTIPEVANRLGLHRCRIVELPRKDANECLQAGVPPQEIAECIMNAQTIDPQELKRAGEFRQEVIDLFYPPDGIRPGFNLPWPKTNGKIRFYPSEMTVWGGYNGSGKSLMLGQIMRAAIAQGYKACIASLEMAPRRTIKRMVQQIHGERPNQHKINDEMDYLNDNLWVFDLVGTGKSVRMLEVFEYAVCRYGIKQFVVDSLAKLGISEDDYAGQKAAVEKLGDFARKHDAHVHLVAHARKGADEFSPPRKLDIKGTGAITDMVDNVYLIHKNKAKYRDLEILEDGGSVRGKTLDAVRVEPDALLICDKSREDGSDAEGIYGLYFDKHFQMYTETQNTLTGASMRVRREEACMNVNTFRKEAE